MESSRLSAWRKAVARTNSANGPRIVCNVQRTALASGCDRVRNTPDEGTRFRLCSPGFEPSRPPLDRLARRHLALILPACRGGYSELIRLSSRSYWLNAMPEPETNKPVPLDDRSTATATAPAGEVAEAEPEPEPWTPERVSEWNAYYDVYVKWAALILVFMVACNYVTDSHVWLHLKTGQLIAKQSAPVTTDVFSYTEPGSLVQHSLAVPVGSRGFVRLRLRRGAGGPDRPDREPSQCRADRRWARWSSSTP